MPFTATVVGGGTYGMVEKEREVRMYYYYEKRKTKKEKLLHGMTSSILCSGWLLLLNESFTLYRCICLLVYTYISIHIILMWKLS